MDRKLYCGAAKRLITPPEEMFGDVCGMVNAEIGKVFDDLYLRVIVLSDGFKKLLFISFDLDRPIDSQFNLPIISEHTGIPVENILYTAIHTHSAPGDKRRNDFGNKNAWNKNRDPDAPRPLPPADGPFSVYVRQRLLEAVDEAIDSLRPAKMGYGFGKSFINVNRCQSFYPKNEDGTLGFDHALGYNAEGPVDRTLFVMKLTDMDDKPIAFLVNYAVHCVVMIWNDIGDGRMGISGDIAGNVSQYMEAEYEGAVAMWTSGAAGDQNPIMMNQSYYPDPVTGESRLYPIQTAETPLMMLKILSSRHFADIKRTIEGIKETSEYTELKTAWDIASTARCEPVQGEDGEITFTPSSQRLPYQIPLHLFRVGDVALMGASAEMCAQRGMTVKNAALMKNTVVINHAGRLDALSGGYVLDDDTIMACIKAKITKKDSLQLKVDNFIPGGGQLCTMPGSIDKALEETTVSLFKEVM